MSQLFIVADVIAVVVWGTAVAGVILTIGLLVRSYRWTNERLPEVRDRDPIGPPEDAQPVDAALKKGRGKIRFQVKRRRIIPFRW